MAYGVNEGQITAVLKILVSGRGYARFWGQVGLSTVEMWISGAKRADFEHAL